VNGAARWDGSSWLPLGTGFLVNSGQYPIAALSWGSDLIAIGEFDEVSGVPAANIARWDGADWHPLDAGLDGEGLALAEFEGDLVAGGEFTQAGGVPATGIARWNGSSWGPIGDNAVEVTALRVVDGRLFAAGAFRCPDGEQAHGLAVWNGTRWEMTGSGIEGDRIHFIEPWNGDLYVGGRFAWANGRASFGIARWMGLSRLAVPSGTPGPVLGLRSAGRNPSASGFDLEFSLPVGGYGRVAVFDLAGRRVATLRSGVLPAGLQRARWNGLEASGRPGRSGVYFARLETARGTRTVKLLLSR
jgi:hypothetical protein